MISGVADAAPERLHRLVYWNAFVPDNESVSDMLPSQCVELFERSAAERGDGSVVPPFQIWREAFINDADLGAAECAYRALNPHPLKTLTDKISFNTNPAGWACRSPMSTAWTTPHRRITHPWHPRLSQKLGLFKADPASRRPRALLFRSSAPRASDHGSRAGLSANRSVAACRPGGSARIRQ
jgi:hypothetical protein